MKANGLNEIVKAFPELSITRKALVFVIPKHGSMNTVQAIVKQNEIVMVEARSPQSVRGFEQYVYRREI